MVVQNIVNFLRQIFVSVDIVAPRYWWIEFDTYKIGTVSNSCSTMHKGAVQYFTISDFGGVEDDTDVFEIIIKRLNELVDQYQKIKILNI